MIEQISMHLATRLKRLAPEHPRSVEVLKYGISFLINTVSIILLSISISLMTNRFLEAITAMAAFALLRQVSGGLHLKSGIMCILVSTAGITLLSLIEINYPSMLTLNSVSILLALLYAPSRIEKQTRIPKKYHPLLKILSIVFISVNYFILSPIVTASFLVQCLTLIWRGGERQ